MESRASYENEEFQYQLQSEMERRVKNSTKVKLERLLSRPQQLPICAEGQSGRTAFRLPLKETRIGCTESPGSTRTTDDSPTGSINLISFAEDWESSPVTGLPNRRGSTQMETSYGTTDDGEKLRKTILELKRVFSRRSTNELTSNGSASSGRFSPTSSETGVRNGYHPGRKTLHNFQRQDSRSEAIAIASLGIGTTSTEHSQISGTIELAPGTSENNFRQLSPNYSHSETATLPTSQNAPHDNQSQEESLKVSEKVVWLAGRERAESGVVMWLGDVGGGPTAGVYFEHPIGNTDGIFKGTRYFKCAANHGGFLPIHALIKYNDYYCCTNSPPTGNSKSSTDNSVTKTDDRNGNNFLSSELSAVSLDTSESDQNLAMRMSDEEDNVIICAICQDPLLMPINFSEYTQSSQSDVGMVSTFCGHLFHAICLNKWFHMKPTQLAQECPYCKKMMDITATIRIFPVLGKP